MALLPLNAGSVPTEESQEWRKTLHTSLTTQGLGTGTGCGFPPVTEASSDASLAAHQTDRRSCPGSQRQLLPSASQPGLATCLPVALVHISSSRARAPCFPHQESR